MVKRVVVCLRLLVLYFEFGVIHILGYIRSYGKVFRYNFLQVNANGFGFIMRFSMYLC